VIQLCYEDAHIFYLEVLLVPALLLIFLAGGVGFVLLLKVRQGRIKMNLSSLKMMTLLGMILKEYKEEWCNFDIIKLNFKILIVLVINFLDSFPVIMAQFTNALLLAYYLLLTRLHPYAYYRTQHLDRNQTLTLMLTV
jgi:hypothetical protein